jgi:ABC-type glycerol-3-phosphate transport system substrate-binding protein
MLKRFLLLFIVVLLTFSFTGCNSGRDAEKDAGNVEEAVQIDLKGEEFIILQDTPLSGYFRYKEDTLFSDEALKRMNDTAASLNCKLTLQELTGGFEGAAKAILNSLAVGEAPGDIYYGDSAGIVSAAKGGGLLPLTDMSEIIDLNNTVKFGTANLLEMMMFDSKPYAVVPALWPDRLPGVSELLVVNNDIVTGKLGLPDMREYIENKTWDWVKFEEMIKACTFDDNGTQIYGIAIDKPILAELAILNNGAKLISENDGLYTTELTSDKTIDALTWAAKLCNDNKDCFAKGQVTDAFLNKQAAMGAMSNWFIMSNVIYEFENYSIMPFPTGPKADSFDAWKTRYTSHVGVSILLNSKDTEASAHIINGLLEPLDSFPTQEDLKNYYAKQVFFDKRDADILFKTAENTVYDYNRVGGFEIFTSFGSSLSSKSAAEMIDTYISKFNTVLEEYVVPNYEYMSTHK